MLFVGPCLSCVNFRLYVSCFGIVSALASQFPTKCGNISMRHALYMCMQLGQERILFVVAQGEGF